MGVDTTILKLNKLAVEHLRNDNYDLSLDLLKKAEVLVNSSKSENLTKLKGITLNNLGCFYKRVGKFHPALHYFNKALEIEIESPNDLINYAGCHLNICAIRSQVGEHEKALSHAMKALNILNLHFETNPNLITSLAIAYHNAGIEFGYLNQPDEAMKFYKKGYDIAVAKLGKNNQITISLKKGLEKSITTIPDISLRASHKNRTNFDTNNFKKSKKKGPSSLPPSHNRENLPLLNDSFSTPKYMLSSNKENPRFYTGDRLQPMHKILEPSYKLQLINPMTKTEKRKKAASRQEYTALIKELDGTYRTKTPGRTLKPITPGSINNSVYTNQSIQVDMFNKPKTPLRQYKTSAAIIIQKHWRGFMTRKKYQMSLCKEKIKKAEEKAKAAILELEKLQTQKKKLFLKQYFKASAQPIQIKKFDRNIHENIMFNHKVKGKNIKKDCIIIIQSHIRRWLVQNRYKKFKAARRIQKFVRGFLTRKIYKHIYSAILLIQRFYRNYKKLM
ncbi:unnamed protein product [Blepharisma stoltei]|uniref:Uncharacterized protein n=1 Tax=Blepharisma stoltei TaxID=1481888 RepID=A0AAU9JBP1_9CILI|nr:unnamed protein product [Blepharisma stoltei]